MQHLPFKLFPLPLLTWLALFLIFLDVQLVFSFRLQPAMFAGKPSKKGPKAAGGGGFGKSAQTVPALVLDEEVKTKWDEAGGDLAVLSQKLFEAKLSEMMEEDAELTQKVVDKLLSLKDTQGATVEDDLTEGEVSKKLIEITWDVVAQTLPITETGPPTQKIAKRMTTIAKCCCATSMEEGGSGRVLDVGCGHGPLVPFLTQKKPAGAGVVAEGGVFGVDLSFEMLRLAAPRFGAAHFLQADLFDLPGAAAAAAAGGGGAAGAAWAAAAEAGFDAVVFHDSLQFFRDPGAALAAARAWLARDARRPAVGAAAGGEEGAPPPRPGARLVVAQARGAAHVAGERAKNPATVARGMPPLAELRALAAALGMRLLVLSPEGGGGGARGAKGAAPRLADVGALLGGAGGGDAAAKEALLDAMLDDFYLAVLEQP